MKKLILIAALFSTASLAQTCEQIFDNSFIAQTVVYQKAVERKLPQAATFKTASVNVCEVGRSYGKQGMSVNNMLLQYSQTDIEADESALYNSYLLIQGWRAGRGDI